MMSYSKKFETPPLRVSRPVSACSKCRAAKVKCDGKLPACSNCERRGRSSDCSSANDQFAKGKERSYVASLEARVEKLEKQIILRRGRQSSVVMADSEGLGTSLKPVVLHTPNDVKNTHKEASIVEDLVSDFGFLSLNATARDFHGVTKEISFAGLVLSASLIEKLPKVTNNELPPRFAITPLIQHFLDNIYVLYPFLSETKLFASIDALYQDEGRHATPIDRWTVRLVLGIAHGSLSRRKDDAGYCDATSHVSAAFDEVETVLHPGSVVGIQGMLLLVLYSMLDPHRFRSWYLIGMACRAMVDLGIHDDGAGPVRLRESELEVRRRVFHSCYVLDRAISMAHLRAFSFTDDSTNVTLETSTSPFSTSVVQSHEQRSLFLHPLDPAVHLFRLRQLLSSAYQRIFQSSRDNDKERIQVVASCLRSLESWMVQLPTVMPRPMKKLFRSEFLFGNILILSSQELFDAMRSHAKALIFKSAVEYADIMSSIDNGSEKLAFYTSYDSLRASFIAEQLIIILEDKSFHLFASGMLDTSQSGNNLPPFPSIPKWTSGEIISKAAKCLNEIERILIFFNDKFGDPSLVTKFRQNAVGLKQMLFSTR